MNKIYQRTIPSFKNAANSKLGGFTLIELLVVVLIIGILAAVALPQYTKVVEKSRAAEALQMVSSIAKANEVYKMTTGEYATDISLLDIEVPGTDVVYSGRPRKETKYFQYGTRSASQASSIAIANRLPNTERYAFIAFEDGTTICHYYNDEDEKFCRSLSDGSKYSLDSSAYIIK